MFVKHAGVRDSNEAKVIVTLEMLCIYSNIFLERHFLENTTVAFMKCLQA